MAGNMIISIAKCDLCGSAHMSSRLSNYPDHNLNFSQYFNITSISRKQTIFEETSRFSK